MASLCDNKSKQFGDDDDDDDDDDVDDNDNDNDNDNEASLQFLVYKLSGTRWTCSVPRDLQRVHRVHGCHARTNFVFSHEYTDIYILSILGPIFPRYLGHLGT